MTILKKLFLMGTLASGMHYGLQAYNPDQIKEIFNFISILNKQNNAEATNIALWLTAKMRYLDNDHELSVLLSAINADAPLVNKILSLMFIQKAEEQAHLKQTIKTTLSAAAILAIIPIGGWLWLQYLRYEASKGWS